MMTTHSFTAFTLRRLLILVLLLAVNSTGSVSDLLSARGTLRQAQVAHAPRTVPLRWPNTTSARPSGATLKEQTAASVAASASSRDGGTISGRVVSDEGHPLMNASVFVVPVGVANQANTTRRTTSTDEDGNFSVSALPPGAYYVLAEAKGYVPTPNQAAQSRQVYRVGDTATLSLMKGGVITGRVTNAAGEPVIAVSVRAYRVRDTDGRRINALSPRDRQTDDRGIYRLYGLEPGVYIVAVNPGANNVTAGSPYNGEAPTYFPSAMRDTAAEVTVQSGDEMSGIDIRYRSERGHAISGAATDAVESSALSSSISVKLLHLPSGALIAQTNIFIGSGNKGFAFYGLPDGEYEMKATREDFAASPARRVRVKGADVTGVQLALAPLSSIAGRVVVETLLQTDKPPACVDQQRARLEETVFTIHRDPPPARDDPWSSAENVPEKTPNDKGDFLLSALEAARYRLETKLSGENLYVRALTLPAALRGQKPIDVSRDGLALKAGERVKDLTVTLAEGAASVRGQITPANESAKLPARLRVYVIPAERESADEVLHYAQVNVQGDGSFTLTNLAPGKYWLLARVMPDDEANEAAPRPAAWDTNERAKLRREAEAAKIEIELQPCQRVNDYTLRYTPPEK